MVSELIFITGGTGFVGSHTVAVALAGGYRVRLSIRKPEQAQGIRERYPEYDSKIETIVIKDITKSESFKGGALKDVSYIFHLASPVPGAGDDFHDDYAKPAVNGTLAILDAALEYPAIKKVVVDSSVLALIPVQAIGDLKVSVLGKSELFLKDNKHETVPFDPEMAFPEGPEGQVIKYAGSKIVAHQATRDWLASSKPSFVVNTLHATFVVGDSLIQNSAESINAVNTFFWGSFYMEKPLMVASWVHVRDVAEAHIQAIENETAPGQEFLLSVPEPSWDTVAEVAKKRHPDAGFALTHPLKTKWTLDISAAEKVLHMRFRSNEAIAADVSDQQLKFRNQE